MAEPTTVSKPADKSESQYPNSPDDPGHMATGGVVASTSRKSNLDERDAGKAKGCDDHATGDNDHGPINGQAVEHSGERCSPAPVLVQAKESLKSSMHTAKLEDVNISKNEGGNSVARTRLTAKPEEQSRSSRLSAVARAKSTSGGASEIRPSASGSVIKNIPVVFPAARSFNSTAKNTNKTSPMTLSSSHASRNRVSESKPAVRDLLAPAVTNRACQGVDIAVGYVQGRKDGEMGDESMDKDEDYDLNARLELRSLVANTAGMAVATPASSSPQKKKRKVRTRLHKGGLAPHLMRNRTWRGLDIIASYVRQGEREEEEEMGEEYVRDEEEVDAEERPRKMRRKA